MRQRLRTLWYRLSQRRNLPGWLALLLVIFTNVTDWVTRVQLVVQNLGFIVTFLKGLWASLASPTGTLLLLIGGLAWIFIATVLIPERTTAVPAVTPRPSPTVPPDSGELAQSLHDWLYEEGWCVSKNYSIRSPDFQLIGYVMAPDGSMQLPINVSYVDVRRQLHVLCGLPIRAPEKQARLDAITGDPKSSLIAEMQVKLFEPGMNYSGLGHPLREIKLWIFLRTDGSLTKVQYLEAITRVRRGSAQMSLMIDGALRQSGL